MKRETLSKNRNGGDKGRRPFLRRLATGVAMVFMLTAVTSAGLSRPAWADTASAGNSGIRANKSQVTADGTSRTTITVTLLDAAYLPVSGKTVSLAPSSGSSTVITPAGGSAGNPGAAVSGVTSSSGEATFQVTDTQAEQVTYTATDTTDNVTVTQTVTVTFAANIGSAGNSTVAASPTSVPADGTSSTITVTLKTAAGTPATGKTVSLAAGGGHSSITTVQGTTNTQGEATFQVTDTKAQQVTYTATDTTDNVTVTQTATVTFTAPDAGTSTVAANSTSVASNGTSYSTITVTLLDAAGNPEDGKTVSLTPSPGSSTVITPTGGSAGNPGAAMSGPTNSSGVATFQVTDAKAEQVTYTATDTTDNVTVTQQATVTFTAPDAGTSTVAATAADVTADGTSYTTITVTLLDAAGNPEGGKTVSLTPSSGSSTVITPKGGSAGNPGAAMSGATNSSGVATFQVTDTQAEQVTYTATDTTDSPHVTVSQAATVTFAANAAVAGQSKLKASPASPWADGTSYSTIKVTLETAEGTCATGKTVSLTPTAGTVSVISPSSATTNSSGVATFQVTDAKAEQVTYTATDLTDNVTVNQTATVTFNSVDAATSTVAASVASVPADGTSHATITVTLEDDTGNPVSDQTVGLTADSTTAGITPAGSGKNVTNTSGQATFRVTDTKAETVTYTATAISGIPNVTVTQTATVTFTSATVDAAMCTVGAGPANVTADGTSYSTITVTLRDANVNPLSGRTVTLAAEGGHSSITTVQGTTNTSGQATFHVTDTKAETVTYTATDATDNVTVPQTAAVTFVQPSGVTPVPAIDTPVVAQDTSVSGTAVANATISLRVDNGTPYSVTADANGNWQVSGLTLATGDSLSVTAQEAGEAVSPAATATVQATLVQTTAPSINLPVYAGATSVSGTAAADATISVAVNNVTAPETQASANGDWTVNGLTLTTGDSLSVTAQEAGEAVSPAATVTVAGDGSGTQADPYLIGNAAQLAAIRNTEGQDVYYRLTADIDLGGVNWTPIGSDFSSATEFAGHFDGAGHVISNLTMSGKLDTTGEIGLFGMTAKGSSIENVGLQNVDLYAGSGGGLVDCNQGSISNCWVTGSVSGSVGGLVDCNLGGSISNCWASDSVSASGDGGGLVANNQGSISDCYATGSVSASGSSGAAGGLAGSDNGVSSISDCYATGSVSAPGSSGTAGGLVGYTTGGATISGSYWDQDTTLQTSSAHGGTGETDGQMKQQATFSGWSTTTWGFHEGLSYPYLKGITPLPAVTVSASPSSGGTVCGTASYNAGAPATVYASPNTGYNFAGWTDGSGNTVSDNVYYSFPMSSSDVVLVADFTQGTPALTPTPTVTTPIVAGDTSVSGTAKPGASVILKVDTAAQPAVNAGANGDWTVSVPALAAGETISVTAQEAGESVSPAQTATVVSQGLQTPAPTIDTAFYWATSVSGTAQANAAIELTVNSGTPYSATADTGGDWSVSGLNLFAGETISATAQEAGELVSPAATTIVASQTPAPVIDTPVYAGATSVSGTAVANATISLSASGAAYTATSGSNGTWTVGDLPALTAGETISVTAQEAGATVSPAQTTTVLGQTALQTPAPVIDTPVYTGAASVSGTAAANATISLAVNGGTATTTQTSANGYWTVAGLALNTGDIISVTAQEAGESVSQGITAVVTAPGSGLVISPTGGSYTAPLTVTISDNSLSVGQAVYYSTAGDPEWVGSGSYFEYPTTSHDLTLNAPATVYAQVYGGGVWGSPASAAYTVNQATHTLIVQASPAADGTVGGGGSYAPNASVSLTATADNGYKFVNWTDAGGNVVSSSASFGYTMPDSGVTLTANFQAASTANTLTVQASPAADGTVSGGGSYPAGAGVPLSATANSGYAFVDWTNGSGNVVSFSSTFTYTMPAQNAALTANFTAGAPTSMTISGFAVTDMNEQPVTGNLTQGNQYLVSMTVHSSSAAAQTPLFLIEAQQGGKVIALNSVQSQILPDGSVTVATLFTPASTGTVDLEFFAWSEWKGQPLAINKQTSVGVD